MKYHIAFDTECNPGYKVTLRQFEATAGGKVRCWYSCHGGNSCMILAAYSAEKKSDRNDPDSMTSMANGYLILLTCPWH